MSQTEIWVNEDNIESLLADVIPEDELSEMDLEDMFEYLRELNAKYI
jgi:hypothetical protein